MYIVWVRILVRPEHLDAFLAASEDNRRHTRQEAGNHRFDVLRRLDDPCRIALFEVYDDEAAFKAHQQTAHYLRWRAAAEPMMAEPRQGERYTEVSADPY